MPRFAAFNRLTSLETSLPAPAANPTLWGHDAAVAQLYALWEQNRLPAGLIFAGPAGIGKATLAYRLIRFALAHGTTTLKADSGLDLFGEEPAALPAPATNLSIVETHQTFQQIAHGHHPDLLVIEQPEPGKDIGVEAVRAIAPFLQRTKIGTSHRFVLIDGAQHLTRQAQNALLKILEEPPAASHLLLVTESAGQMLPTIRSRCQLLRLSPPPAEPVLSVLQAQYPHVPTATLKFLFAVCSGAPGQTAWLLDNKVVSFLQILSDTALLKQPLERHQLAQKYAPQTQDYQLLLWLLPNLADFLLREKAYNKISSWGAPWDDRIQNTSLPQALPLADKLRQHCLDAINQYLEQRQALRMALQIFAAL